MKSSVMIVDDSNSELLILEDVFSSIDPDVSISTATSGTQALERLRAASVLPHVILLDVRMPGISGIQVLRQLKADPRLRRIPVCNFSNGDLEQDVVDCYDAGASFYFRKPTGLNHLREFAQCFLSLWFEYAVHQQH